jgi:hypothetical protein
LISPTKSNQIKSFDTLTAVEYHCKAKHLCDELGTIVQDAEQNPLYVLNVADQPLPIPKICCRRYSLRKPSEGTFCHKGWFHVWSGLEWIVSLTFNLIFWGCPSLIYLPFLDSAYQDSVAISLFGVPCSKFREVINHYVFI